MGFLEDAILKAKGAADYAGKKTGEFVELSKLKVSAAEVEKKIDSEYQELGKMVYNAAKEHTDCTEYVEEKAAAIDLLFTKHSELMDQIEEMKKLKKCPKCGHTNKPDAKFCSECGAEL